LGVPESDARWYAEGVRQGGVLVTVFADDDRAEEAAEVMRLYGAIDIDEQAQSWSQEGASFNERQARSTEVEAETLGEPYGQRENISAMDDEEFLRHFKATYGQRGER